MVKQLQKTDSTMRIKFVRNTPYNGVEYGPDYAQDTADVEQSQAQIWIIKQRAVAVTDADAAYAAINSPDLEKAITPAVAVAGSSSAEVGREKENATTHVETAAGDIPPIQQINQERTAQTKISPAKNSRAK